MEYVIGDNGIVKWVDSDQTAPKRSTVINILQVLAYLHENASFCLLNSVFLSLMLDKHVYTTFVSDIFS